MKHETRTFSPHHHSQLLMGCLDLMLRTLKKNMCKLPDGVANSDVGDMEARIEQYINPALQYACKSWYIHLTDKHKISVPILNITSTLHQFLRKKFLFWLEVLSVLGGVRSAVDALQAVVGWLKVRRDFMTILPEVPDNLFRNHLRSTLPASAFVLYPHTLTSVHPLPTSTTRHRYWPQERRSCGGCVVHTLDLSHELYVGYQFHGIHIQQLRRIASKSVGPRGRLVTGLSRSAHHTPWRWTYLIRPPSRNFKVSSLQDKNKAIGTSFSPLTAVR